MNVQDIIGTNKIENTIELYYVCLLGKYIKNRNGRLSLDGADITSFADTIENSMYYEFFKYASENGFINDLPIELDTFNGEESELAKFLFMDSFDNVKPYFYNIEENRFYINLKDTGGNMVNLRMFKESIEESSIIDLTAYLHVSGLYENKSYELHPKFSSTVRESSLGVASLYYISMSSISNNILKFRTYDIKESRSLGYSSWYFLGRELGLLSDDGYSVIKKRELLKQDCYQVGNVVFLYERTSTSKSRGSKGKLISCVTAIVRAVNGNNITLERVPFHHTKVSRRKSFENYSRGVQELFQYADFEPVTMKETFSLTSLGVGYLMSDGPESFETEFIAPVNTTRKVELWVEQDGFEFELLMDYADAIFWVLKDWDIEFDEDLYVRTYYSEGRTPLYYQELVDDFGVTF